MTASDKPARQPTVLCVDDAENVLRALQRELRRFGCRVLTANNGKDALDLLERQPVEILVCDYAMPGMLGTEVLERAKEISPGTMRILLSAHSCEPDVAIPAVNDGEVYRLLLKPWEEKDIRRVVADALGLEPKEWQQMQTRTLERLRGAT